MTESDPSMWQQISGWLWAVLAVPMKMLWSKADGAASKEELAEAIKQQVIQNGETRTMIRQIFDDNERDRAKASDDMSKVQSQWHDQHIELTHTIQANYVELLREIRKP